MAFTKATKEQSKLRVALDGVSGSGKTYTALTLATVFAQGQPVAVVDTERGSASKYADIFDFDVLNLESFHPDRYIEAIHDAEQGGYAVLVIDSLSHAWTGKDGALELVDRAAKRSQAGNSFTAWRDVTPLHNRLVDAMLAANLHLIVTMRSKTEYTLVENERGKKEPRKIGMAPVQRDGMEYEFDIVGDMDTSNTLIISKTRCPALVGGIFERPNAKLAETMLQWATSGASAREKPHGLTERQQKIKQWWAEIQVAGAEHGVEVPDVDLDLPSEKLKELETYWNGEIHRKQNALPEKEKVGA
jgi:hypothetical protein